MNSHRKLVSLLPVALTVFLLIGCGETDTESQQNLSSALPAPTSLCGEATETTLLAGQHIETGTVEVNNDEENLYVTFHTFDGWTLGETHVAVGATSEELPQTPSGNPIPGQFTYSDTHEEAVTYTYVIPLGEAVAGDDQYIAAHAVVRLQSEDDHRQKESAWGEGPSFPGANWAMYFLHTLQECDVVEETAEQGCSPGYWRQSHHFESWKDYTPYEFFDDVFGREINQDMILGDGIQLGGGELNALIRHSVAALLNAASDDVDYPFTVAEVKSSFQAAFDSEQYEATKDIFDNANNLGCPL